MIQTGDRKNRDGFQTAKFGVEIAGVVEAEFTQASGLEAEIEVMEYMEGGNNRFVYKLPGRVKYTNITLKRPINLSRSFIDWFTVGLNEGMVQRRGMSIIAFDHESVPIKRWNFIDAYPIKWTGPTFNSSENSVAVETLVIAHHGMVPT